MRKEIIINSTASEHRIAILEDGKLAELFVKTPEKERNVGDIYLGKVAKVMHGIRAAFVDIGLEQDAFLHFSDIGTVEAYNAMFDDDDEGGEEEGNGAPPAQAQRAQGQQKEKGQGEVAGQDQEGRGRNGRGDRRAQEVNLQKGQDILVQVTKEPQGKKGVRVRSEISLPGRFLVLIPFDGKVGASKKLNNFKERRRLKKVVRGFLPKGFGAIIRTVAEGKTDEMLKQDLEQLVSHWHDIERSVKNVTAPALIYKDMDTTSSVIRDLFQDTVEKIVTDDKKLYKEIKAYVEASSPTMSDRIELYKQKAPVFDAFGIEKDFQNLFSKKIWLKSGGYLYIERTEAMTVIDVNSGRYAAKREQELNSLKTDLEAAREIARQLRLRDIGGLVVVDFIDLDEDKNRKKVYDEMKKELRRDRAKVTVLPMTEFGLVQLTRQRIRETVLLSFSEPCPTCGGSGFVQSKGATINEIERWIRRFASARKGWKVELRVNPSIAEQLTHGTISRMVRIQLKLFVKVRVVPDENIAADDYIFISPRDKKDITDQFTS